MGVIIYNDFCISTMKYQKEKLGENFPFTIATTTTTKKTKYLGINLTKELRDLDSENYRTLKKLRKIQITGSIYCVHGLEELI